MLGNVQAVNAGCLGGFSKVQPLVKQPRQRPITVLDMIKQSHLHRASLGQIFRSIIPGSYRTCREANWFSGDESKRTSLVAADQAGRLGGPYRCNPRRSSDARRECREWQALRRD